MASHHRRKRQQDARVEMEAVEEGKEEEEEDEDEVGKIGFRRVVAAVVVFGTGRRGSAFAPWGNSVSWKGGSGRRRSSANRLVERLTKDLVETFRICNPKFKYLEEPDLKRFLTSPADGVLNDGHDNIETNLILNVNHVLLNSRTGRRYIVKDILGRGTFGQVAKCWVPDINNFLAVKIIKNDPAYYQQAWVEVSILKKLNEEFDPDDKHHIVRMYDCFVFQHHLCITFELLGRNLYELIKLNDHRGLSLSIVQLFSKQILRGLALMKDAAIIHCDLKPENVLLGTSVKPEVKIIDFGSACMEERTVYSYIQSRYYRSPEVVLGYQYTTAIDMWSFGCIVAELFLGLPLFPGKSEFDLLLRMIRILGAQPPDYLLNDATNTSKFFKHIASVRQFDRRDISQGVGSLYRALTEDEYVARANIKPDIGKEYFHFMDLEKIIKDYPYRRDISEDDRIKEGNLRLALTDFLKGLVEFDPAKRWSPFQAMNHPFLTGEPFTSAYRPPSETPHVPVAQNFVVGHHPGGGHWFVAGLSPNVPGRNNAMHASPQLQFLQHAHGSSYGSVGSHGSYGDCAAMGSSCGSYGDNVNAFAYFSPAGQSGNGIHLRGGLSIVGATPDCKWNMAHHSQGFGASPSGGSFAPLPLGTSPSQLTPPNSLSHISGSPGHFGPASPARGSSLGSPLGKGAALSPFSRRTWGYSGNVQPQDGSSSSYSQGQSTQGWISCQGDGDFQVHSSPLNMSSNSHVSNNWKPPQGATVVASNYSSVVNLPNSIPHGPYASSPQSKGAAKDRPEMGLSLPDPSDWDPNYREELLLQDDGPDISSVASQLSYGLQISQHAVHSNKFVGFGTSNHNYPSSSKLVTRHGPTQAFTQFEVGSPPSNHDPHAGYGRSLPKSCFYPPHLSHNSLTRFGQLPVQQFNHGRTFEPHASDVPHPKQQYHPFGFGTGSYTPGNVPFHNGSSWGRRGNYSVPSVPSSSCDREDYTGIA